MSWRRAADDGGVVPVAREVLDDGSCWPTEKPELMCPMSVGALLELPDVIRVMLIEAAASGRDLRALAALPFPDGNGEVPVGKLWLSGYAAGVLAERQVDA